MTPEEKKSIEMYRFHDILEWTEKSQVLSSKELEEVERYLREGKMSPLLEILKLPFPMFAYEYFKKLGSVNRFLIDPAFGYKMYMLSDKLRVFFANMSRAKKPSDIPNMYKKNFSEYLTELEDIFSLPLDKISAQKNRDERDLKFIYLTQYITASVATELNLQFGKCLIGQEDGYELEKKLQALNLFPRIIASHALGLYGLKRKKIESIAQFLNVNSSIAVRLWRELKPMLELPYLDFIRKIGLQVQSEESEGIKLYSNETYKNLDLNLHMSWLYNNVLSDLEKGVLATLNQKNTRIYIARKYMFDNPETIARYLSASDIKVSKYGELSGHTKI